MTRRRLAAIACALALASACQSPTAPEYAGPCSLGVPREAPFVRICYAQCPPGTESYAAGADLSYAAEFQC